MHKRQGKIYAVRKPKMMKSAKISSDSSEPESTTFSTLKRTRDAMESPKLEPSKDSSSTWKKNSEEPIMVGSLVRPLSSEEILQLRVLLEKRAPVIPLGPLKKVVGIIKKAGENFGRLFSCLQNVEGRTVAKSWKLLDGTLKDHGVECSGDRTLPDGRRKDFHYWKSIESGDIIRGTYSETISAPEGFEPSTEEVDEFSQ